MRHKTNRLYSLNFQRKRKRFSITSPLPNQAGDFPALLWLEKERPPPCRHLAFAVRQMAVARGDQKFLESQIGLGQPAGKLLENPLIIGVSHRFKHGTKPQVGADVVPRHR